MKRSIDLVLTSTRIQTVEVDFPIYRREDHYPPTGDFVTYTRVEADLRELVIEYRGDGCNVKYEIETKQGTRCLADDGEHDHFLGEGIYECAPDTFAKVLDEAIAFLTSMKSL